MHHKLKLSSRNGIWPAIHLSQNTRKWAQNGKNEKWIARYFAPLFSHFAPLFLLFALRSISRNGRHSRENSKGFHDLFFRGINKTRNSSEMRKMYSECFAFCGVFYEIPVKCEKWKVYSWPYKCCETSMMACVIWIVLQSIWGLFSFPFFFVSQEAMLRNEMKWNLILTRKKNACLVHKI